MTLLLRIGIAFVLSASLLYVAGRNSKGRPEYVRHSENGFTFEMTTVPKALEAGHVRIPIKITGALEPNLKLLIRTSKYGQNATTDLHRYGSVPLIVEDSAAGLYYANISTGKRGLKLYYYFEIRDETGGYRAGFMGPDRMPFVLKFIGEVPSLVLFSHIALMAITVFFVTLGFLYAISLVRYNQDAGSLALCLFLAAVAAFLGGYPFGFAMNHYAFGTVWEGVPFGTDFTDNKTQMLFVFLLFVFLSSLGSLSKGKIGSDLYPPRTLGWFGLTAFVIMLVLYLIPHSIQFTPGLTKAISYSFIGLVAILFGTGWLQTFRKERSVSRTARDNQPL